MKAVQQENDLPRAPEDDGKRQVRTDGGYVGICARRQMNHDLIGSRAVRRTTALQLHPYSSTNEGTKAIWGNFSCLFADMRTGKGDRGRTENMKLVVGRT